MQINLVDLNEELCKEWERLFSSHSDVSIYNESYFDIDSECVVSPANSFGFMDGGLDYLISTVCGWDVQDRLQAVIKDTHHGELLVGCAELVPTNHKTVKYVLSAPTMRVPEFINGTVNVYLASKAIFRMVKETDKFSSINISGLGTGVGRVSPKVCAIQMYAAYKEVILGDVPKISTWRNAQHVDNNLKMGR